jgi:hypothetical protein
MMEDIIINIAFMLACIGFYITFSQWILEKWGYYIDKMMEGNNPLLQLLAGIIIAFATIEKDFKYKNYSKSKTGNPANYGVFFKPSKDSDYTDCKGKPSPLRHIDKSSIDDVEESTTNEQNRFFGGLGKWGRGAVPF